MQLLCFKPGSVLHGLGYEASSLVVCMMDLSAGEDYTIELIGVMATPKLPTTVSMDLTISLGPLFFTWVVQMLLPVL